MNEIKTLMETEGNVEKVNESVALFKKSLEDFKGVHDSIQKFCLRKKRKRRELVGMNQEYPHLWTSLRTWKSGNFLKMIPRH